MAGIGGGGDFQLTHTSISINGVSGAVQFFNLNILQTMADVCSGSFHWRQEGNTTLQDQIKFYDRYMGSQVDVSIGDNYRFSGVITAIYLHNEDIEASEYMIHFAGMAVRINQYRECNSWIKKTFGDMISGMDLAGAPVKRPDADTGEQFYTVQYNQTSFEFLRMMATRLGLWMYYDGRTLLFNAPAGPAIELMKDRDIQEITLNTMSNRSHRTLSGFDTYKGTVIGSKVATPSATGIIGSALKSGSDIYGDNITSLHVPHAANEQVLGNMNNLLGQSVAASSVLLQGHTHHPDLNLGKKIKVLETNGASGGEFIITQITHSCPHDDSYTNFIQFIPADIHVPPYTNPVVHPVCEPQPAIVVDNVDKDGHDRIKVHFPWMKPGETTPWISMVTPYAGANKGMRFIPEKNEEVMIDFLAGNAERPYAIGTLFTGANKSGIDVNDNCVKAIGTGSGRRFEINDCAGTLKMYDNYANKTPKNAVLMTRKDEETKTIIESQYDNQNYSVVVLNNQDFLNLGIVSGGALVTEIRMEKDGKKITIKSDTSIDIQSSTINMSGENINIKASKELKLEGTQKGASIAGQKINFDGTSDVSIKGINVGIEASANLELKGAMASLTGGLVKIN